MEKFAFIIHPLDAKRDAARKYPIAKYLPTSVVEWGLSKKSPMLVSHVTGIKSKTGVEAEGWLVGCPLTPKQMIELPIDFAQFLPADLAINFAYLSDASDFYVKGPSIRESNHVTDNIAQGLLDDFFSEVDAIAKGDYSHGAKLRFAHAEVMIPFVTAIGLKGMSTPLPLGVNYSYKNH